MASIVVSTETTLEFKDGSSAGAAVITSSILVIVVSNVVVRFNA
jgi:hypothetical protein